MNDVDLRTRIFEELHTRRKASSDDVGAIEIANLADAVGDSAKRVAVICSELVRHGHVDGDGNMMGFVRLPDAGVGYYEEVREMNE